MSPGPTTSPMGRPKPIPPAAKATSLTILGATRPSPTISCPRRSSHPGLSRLLPTIPLKGEEPHPRPNPAGKRKSGPTDHPLGKTH